MAFELEFALQIVVLAAHFDVEAFLEPLLVRVETSELAFEDNLVLQMFSGKADATVRKTSAASLDKHFHFNESEFPTETNLMTNNGNDVSSSEIPTSPSLPVSCTSTATVNAIGSLKRKPGRRSVPPPRRKTRASFSVASAHYPSTRRTLSFKDTRLVTSPSQNLLRVTSRASLNRRASLTPSLRRLQVRFAAQIEVGPKFERPKFQG